MSGGEGVVERLRATFTFLAGLTDSQFVSMASGDEGETFKNTLVGTFGSALDALEALRAERDDYEQLSRAASGEADVLRARIAQLEEAARALACRNRALDRRRVRALVEPPHA